MARGQKRSNREAKKPKAPKKPPPAAVSPFIREPPAKRPTPARGGS